MEMKTVEDRLAFAVRFAQTDLAHTTQRDTLSLRLDVLRFLGVDTTRPHIHLFWGSGSSLINFPSKRTARAQKVVMDFMERALMSGHIHWGASSHECDLVRALDYDTPRLLDYSPYRVYRERAPLGTWPPTQRDYYLCGRDH